MGVNWSTRLASDLRVDRLGTDIGRRPEFPQHRMQPFGHVLGDSIEQESGGPDGQRRA